MSQENIEVVRASHERWSEGDFRVSVDLFDPHAVWVIGPDFLDAGTYFGIDAIAAYMRGLLEPWTHLTMEAEEIAPAGDSVLVGVHQRGDGTTSGIPTEDHHFMLWSFRGRNVIRLEGFRDRSDALEAAGLRE